MMKGLETVRSAISVGWVELFAIPISHEESVVMGFVSGTGPVGRTRWLYPSYELHTRHRRSWNFAMRSRPSARLLVLNPSGRVLLFRFVFKNGALAGQDYWATPGGGVEEGETFEQAAIRELAEETGMRLRDIGPEVGQREFVLQLPDGERVMADERYFLVRSEATSLSRDGWTALEAEVMVDHRWWSRDELAQTSDTVWPEDLLVMISAAMGVS